MRDLKALVASFQKKRTKLADVPKELVNEYGYPAIANALLFDVAETPMVDGDPIEEYVSSHTFPTLGSFVAYVAKLDGDIEKLYGIFCWASMNLLYDTEGDAEGGHGDDSAEAVFETMKCVCAGYTNFFMHVAERAGLTDSVVLGHYSSLAKAFGYNYMCPPRSMKSDHASVYVKIDGEPFICEPTWGSGSMSEDKRFTACFNREYFLLPVEARMAVYYPEDSEKLPFNVSFDEFKKAARIDFFRHGLKAESHPLGRFSVTDGYAEMQFSYVGDANAMSVKCAVIDGKVLRSVGTDSWVSYVTMDEIVQRHPGRVRIKACIAFPDKGVYELRIFVYRKESIVYWVDVDKGSSKYVPSKMPIDETLMFCNIAPKTLVSDVHDGVGVVRFAANRDRGMSSIHVYRLDNLRNCGKMCEVKDIWQLRRVIIPFDDSCYEHCGVITFPEDGNYKIDVFFPNADGKTRTCMVSYFMSVAGTKKHQFAFPEDVIGYGRQSPPAVMKMKGYSVSPAAQTVIVTDRMCQMTITTPKKSGKISWQLSCLTDPIAHGIDHRSERKGCEVYFQWKFPHTGYYKGTLWDDEDNFAVLYYVYWDGKTDNSAKNEKIVMKLLKEELSKRGAKPVKPVVDAQPAARWNRSDLFAWESFTSNDGYMKCELYSDALSGSLQRHCAIRRGEEWVSVDHEAWTSIRAVDCRDADPSRFYICAAFPEIGRYRVLVLISEVCIAAYYVTVKRASKRRVPIHVPFDNWPRFIPMVPETHICDTSNGFIVIRFAVSIDRSDILPKAFKLDNLKNLTRIDDVSDRMLYERLIIPFDDTRCENCICVTFPENGTYSVPIFLQSDDGDYTQFITYFVNVTGADQNSRIHPCDVICHGREYIHIPLDNGFKLSPPDSVIVTSNAKCKMVVHRPSASTELVTAFMAQDVDDSRQLSISREDKGADVTLVWTIPEPGKWVMKMSMGGPIFAEQGYILYEKEPPAPSQAENAIMKRLSTEVSGHLAVDEELMCSGGGPRVTEKYARNEQAISLLYSGREVDTEYDDDEGDFMFNPDGEPEEAPKVHGKSAAESVLDRKLNRVNSRTPFQLELPSNALINEYNSELIKAAQRSARESGRALKKCSQRRSGNRKGREFTREKGLFMTYDTDRDRLLDARELQNYLDAEQSDAQDDARALLATLTGKSSGKLTFAQFVKFVHGDESISIAEDADPYDGSLKSKCCLIV